MTKRSGAGICLEQIRIGLARDSLNKILILIFSPVLCEEFSFDGDSVSLLHIYTDHSRGNSSKFLSLFIINHGNHSIASGRG